MAAADWASIEGRMLGIIVAGGVGSRLGRSEGKQLVPIAGRPMLAHTLDAFRAARSVGYIVLVCHPDRVDEYREAVATGGEGANVLVVPGGSTRQESVASGLRHMPEGYDIVAVHDGARPLIQPETIDGAARRLMNEDGVSGVVVGYPVVDTLKVVADGVVVDTADRTQHWLAQTPQVFRTEILLEAHARATSADRLGTDDAMLVEEYGERVVMFEGRRDNFKVTLPEDVVLAEAVLRFRANGTEEDES